MAASATPQTTAAWVASALAALLRAPHISLPPPPAGIRLGPGPVDVFSTRFENTFAPGAAGAVDGRRVDREGLKRSLLALQSHYDPDTAEFDLRDADSEAGYGQGDDVRGSFAWTTKDAVRDEVFTEAVVVVTQGGAQQISALVLKGKQELFVAANNS